MLKLHILHPNLGKRFKVNGHFKKNQVMKQGSVIKIQRTKSGTFLAAIWCAWHYLPSWHRSIFIFAWQYSVSIPLVKVNTYMCLAIFSVHPHDTSEYPYVIGNIQCPSSWCRWISIRAWQHSVSILMALFSIFLCLAVFNVHPHDAGFYFILFPLSKCRWLSICAWQY